MSPDRGSGDQGAVGGSAGVAETAAADPTIIEIARMWVEFRLLSRHGPCRNCERMHGALARVQQVLAAAAGDAEAERLLRAIREVRRPAELHPPLGCLPCSTEAALRKGSAYPAPAPSARDR